MSFLSRLLQRKTSHSSQTSIIGSSTFINPHSTLGELDFHLINEGRHEKLWEALGAHILRDNEGALLGTAFSVWAPNAQAVSLISDNNFGIKILIPWCVKVFQESGKSLLQIAAPALATNLQSAAKMADG